MLLTNRQGEGPIVRDRIAGFRSLRRRSTRRYEGLGWGPAHMYAWIAGVLAGRAHKMWEAPAMYQRTSVGLDVHARSVMACGLDGMAGVLVERRLIPEPVEVRDWIRQFAGTGRGCLRSRPDGVRTGAVLTRYWRRWIAATDTAIAAMAADSDYAPVVRRLSFLRGTRH